MSGEKCASCERPLGNVPSVRVNGKITCHTCRDAGVKLAPIVAIGAVASAACDAAWAMLIAVTRSEIGFAAVGVGYAVGCAASISSLRTWCASLPRAPRTSASTGYRPGSTRALPLPSLQPGYLAP